MDQIVQHVVNIFNDFYGLSAHRIADCRWPVFHGGDQVSAVSPDRRDVPGHPRTQE